MRRSSAAAGSAVFLILVPGTVAGLVPWLLTRWRADRWWLSGWWSTPVRIAGWALLVMGVATLIHAFSRFVIDGLGTPAPVAAPQHLVVTGLYRHVRNPMYLAVEAVIIGQALVLGGVTMVGYGVVVGAAFWSFAHWYEEPTLIRRFGQQYELYRRAVPGWRPRLRPWP